MRRRKPPANPYRKWLDALRDLYVARVSSSPAPRS